MLESERHIDSYSDSYYREQVSPTMQSSQLESISGGQYIPTPPVAEQQAYILRQHGDERVDSYFWMRDRTNPAVVAYLEAENEYTQAVMQHTEPLQKRLYAEMLARIQETDLSVPTRKDDYYYYTRTEAGKAYPIHCRKHGSLEAAEEILLDQNQLAAGHDYFALGAFQVSPNHQVLAYSVDTSGAERYTLYFVDLNTRQTYAESIPGTYGAVVWGSANQTVFYTLVDAANRPFKLMRHSLGNPVTADVLIYHEPDDAYYLNLYKTRSQAYIVMELSSGVTSEVHVLAANDPCGTFQILQTRSPGIEYTLDHHGDYFYIRTNEDAVNFKLMKAPIASPQRDQWQTVIPHRQEVLLADISVFVDHLIVYERQAGLPQVRVRQWSNGKEYYIAFPEPTYEIYEAANPEFDTHVLRFKYTSLITPTSIFDYNLLTQEQTLQKETPVLGGYDRTQYVSERLYATAADSTAIPLSLVYRRGTERDGRNPVLMVGYGSYGFSYPDAFSANRLSLLDRGVVVAIAHVRGGSEMGRTWYESGKFLNKQNTFTDFIACAEHLIQERWTSTHKLAIAGGSAGGLLVGATINLRPDLFKAAVAQVPFVDVVTTILDTSLPLSVKEWEEWGNPNDKIYYDYMKSYSPYDNVESKDYPALLITAGFNDPRVSYWEPAKWAAKLRALKTDRNILLLKTNMGAGHAGASGRYGHLKEIAFEYAFLLDQWGRSE